MLRDYQYTSDKQLVINAVSQFADAAGEFEIVGFTSLSPDSFLWILSSDKGVYYLYAEDFIDDYKIAEHAAAEYAAAFAKLTFIPAKQPLQFEQSSPYQSASVYKPPSNITEFQKYAGQSGYDFVFLLRSSEKI